MKSSPRSSPATTRGRPRAFDINAATVTALKLFWQKGYDQTSIADLTTAMGINRPSFYSAFGDKQALFQRALALYGSQFHAIELLETIEDPRQAIEAFFNEQARLFVTTPVPGCMAIHNRTTCCSESAVAKTIRQTTAHVQKALRKRVSQLKLDVSVEAMVDHLFGTMVAMTAAAREGATEKRLRQMGQLALRAINS